MLMALPLNNFDIGTRERKISAQIIAWQIIWKSIQLFSLGISQKTFWYKISCLRTVT